MTKIHVTEAEAKKAKPIVCGIVDRAFFNGYVAHQIELDSGVIKQLFWTGA